MKFIFEKRKRKQQGCPVNGAVFYFEEEADKWICPESRAIFKEYFSGK